MKILYIVLAIAISLLFLFAGLSCSKQRTAKVCYICTLGDSPNGQHNAPETVCDEDAPNKQFRDDKGNDLSSYCTKK